MQFKLDGETVSYKKEFAEVQFDDVQIDFTIGTGKVFPNGRNQFYFVASKGEKKIFRTQISNATIFKQHGNQYFNIANNVNSNEEGMGKFFIDILRTDISNGAKFYMKVQFNEFVSKNFLIFDTASQEYSDVQVIFQKLVYNGDESVQLQLQRSNDKNLLIVLQDKTNVFHQKTLKKNQNSHQINLGKINLPNAGVYNIQVYSQTDEEMAIQQEKEQEKVADE